jgi:hypothetical protein
MMPRPSRDERLAQAEASTRLKMETQRKHLAAIQAQQREEAKKARDRRRYEVGTIADACGLLGLDDAVLRPLFAVLQGVTHTPNPVALLEALLCAADGVSGRSVDGFAHLPVVSGLRPDEG